MPWTSTISSHLSHFRPRCLRTGSRIVRPLLPSHQRSIHSTAASVSQINIQIEEESREIEVAEDRDDRNPFASDHSYPINRRHPRPRLSSCKSSLLHSQRCSYSSVTTPILHPAHTASFSSSSNDSNNNTVSSAIPECSDPTLNPAHPPVVDYNPASLSSLGLAVPHRLLVYKKVTTLEEIRRGIKNSVDFPFLREDSKVLAADREHQHTIAVVRESIIVSGVEWKEVEQITDEDIAWCQCIICVGGDGTFLKASRYIAENHRIPIVGVNSAPSSSFGFFCAADHHSFPHVLYRILQGNAIITPLWRMKLCINNKVTPAPPILNELLFCNPIPSATTRYLLTNGGITQLQQSSGIWVSTAAGSTGAILGAGGHLMNLSDYRFQFRVRELFSLPITHPRHLEAQQDFPHIHYSSSSSSDESLSARIPTSSKQPPVILTDGYLAEDFQFVSRMMTGCVFLDGSVIAIPIQFNDSVRVRRTILPLYWVCPTKDEHGLEPCDHWELVTGRRRSSQNTDIATQIVKQDHVETHIQVETETHSTHRDEEDKNDNHVPSHLGRRNRDDSSTE